MNRARRIRRARETIARAIARALLSVWPEREPMILRAAEALGYRWAFIDRLVDRSLDHHGRFPPTLRQLAASVAADPDLLAVWTGDAHGADRGARLEGHRLEVATLFILPPQMAIDRPWPVPEIRTEADLAKLLNIDPRDFPLLTARSGNYHYTWRQKPGGNLRLIEAPKVRLKLAQKTIARHIVPAIPADPAAHGFRAGRSIATHAREHVARDVVIRIDLAEFFPSISAGRVIALFHRAGYPDAVARALAMLTTQATPREVLREQHRELDPRSRALLSRRHLPQGAPSSPAIANLCAFRLDRRLDGLARSFGATYSRYADDLTFSGDRRLSSKSEVFVALVTAIAGDEGFRVRARKTKIMTQAVRQTVCGVVVNARPSTTRREYETLKAILHNVARFGPSSQNRAQHPDFPAHLRGRIAYVSMLDASRGEKLRAIFERISWGS